tara:strand:+ start:386 stop:658 length:273 start_codon:yes stop_codon:yes gene_type:complete
MNAPSPNMMNAPRAPAGVTPIATTNASKPAATTTGMARHLNARNALIVIAVLVGAYMAWPMVFPTKPPAEPVVEVIEAEKDADDNGMEEA